MTRSRLTLTASLILVLLAARGASVSAGAPLATSAVRKQLEAIYGEYSQSFKARDASLLRKWAERYLAPNAINKEEDGSQETRQQFLDGLPKGPWLPATEVRGKIEQLTVHGNTATVVYSQRLVKRPVDPRGKRHKTVVLSMERDTWIQTPQGWQTTMSVNTSHKATLDGKPLPPRPMPSPSGAGGSSRSL